VDETLRRRRSIHWSGGSRPSRRLRKAQASGCLTPAPSPRQCGSSTRRVYRKTALSRLSPVPPPDLKGQLRVRVAPLPASTGMAAICALRPSTVAASDHCNPPFAMFRRRLDQCRLRADFCRSPFARGQTASDQIPDVLRHRKPRLGRCRPKPDRRLTVAKTATLSQLKHLLRSGRIAYRSISSSSRSSSRPVNPMIVPSLAPFDRRGENSRRRNARRIFVKARSSRGA
jgi:hypothetical protein